MCFDLENYFDKLTGYNSNIATECLYIIRNGEVLINEPMFLSKNYALEFYRQIFDSESKCVEEGLRTLGLEKGLIELKREGLSDVIKITRIISKNCGYIIFEDENEEKIIALMKLKNVSIDKMNNYISLLKEKQSKLGATINVFRFMEGKQIEFIP